MLWETDAATVVMVTGLVEKGKAKCERYWPASPDGSTMKFGAITVETQQVVAGQGYNFHMLRVTMGKEVCGQANICVLSRRTLQVATNNHSHNRSYDQSSPTSLSSSPLPAAT